MPRSRYQQPANNQTTVLAIAGVVVVAVIVVMVVVMSGGKSDDLPTPADQPAQAEVPQKKGEPEARKQARWWLEEQLYDDYGKHKVLTGGQVHTVVTKAKELGHDKALGKEWRKRLTTLYDLLLKREPDDPDANRFFGRYPLSDYTDFFKVFKRMSDERAMPKEFEALRDKYEPEVHYGPRWRTPAVDQAEFRRVSLVLNRYVIYAKRMRENPSAKAIEEALARVKLHPILGSYETVHIERPPWVLFYAHKDLTKRNDSKAEEARVAKKREDLRKRLDSYTQLLDDYLAFFKKTWIEPLGLPAFAPRQLFYVWMFDDRKRFDQFGASIRQRTPPTVLGYFNPRDRWVYIYEPAKKRYTVESSLSHEMTHQLHWHFSKDKGPFENHFSRSKAQWFKEGWGEYIGAGVKAGSSYTFCGDAPERMDLIHVMKKSKLPLLPIRLLVRSENYIQYLRTVVGINIFSSPPTLVEGGWLQKELAKQKKTTSGAGAVLAADLYFGLLYSQGWLLVKFLHEGNDGKYRKKMMRFIKFNLKGYLGLTGKRGYLQPHEAFAHVFSLKTDTDWAALQKDFDAYVERKLYEIPPTKALGK